MFDNPSAIDWQPRPERPAADLRVAAVLLTLLIGGLLFWSQASGPSAVVIYSAPTHLQQIEVIQRGADSGGNGITAFYIHNAGYRLLHKPHLIALIGGARIEAVTWAPGVATVHLAPGWRTRMAGAAPGIQVKFVTD